MTKASDQREDSFNKKQTQVRFNTFPVGFHCGKRNLSFLCKTMEKARPVSIKTENRNMKAVFSPIGIMILQIIVFMIYRYFAFKQESAQTHKLRFGRILPLQERIEDKEVEPKEKAN